MGRVDIKEHFKEGCVVNIEKKGTAKMWLLKQLIFKNVL